MINIEIYKNVLQKILFLFVILAFCSFSHTSMAKDLKCEKGELNLDLMTTTFVPRDRYKAYIYGTYHTTVPFEKYIFKFDEKVLAGVMSAKMILTMDDLGPAVKDTDEPTVIEFRKSFEVAPRTKGIYIEVAKSLISGNRYVDFFWVNFKDIDMAISRVGADKISVCLKPEEYR